MNGVIRGWDKVISELLEITGKKIGVLASDLGVETRYIADLKAGRSKNPSSDFIASLVIDMGISPIWLFTGQGPLYSDRREESSQTTTGDVPKDVGLAHGEDHLPTNRSGTGVPYFDIDVAAHWASDVPGAVEPKPEFYVDFQPFNDCSAFLPVYGDSMFPMIASGDVVAVKEIKNRSIILWGEPYLVMTNADADNMRTVKLIHQHDNPAYVNLRASNPNYKGDIPVPRDSIIGLYIVKGIVTRKQL